VRGACYLCPAGVGEEDLGDVACHRHQVEPQLVRQRCHGAVNPADPVGERLAARDVQRGERRIEAGHRMAAPGKETGEHAGAAADVEHVAGAELRRHRRVDVEVAAVGVERVIQHRESRVFEVRIGHAD